MSHIEIKRTNGNEYASFVKKFRLMSREFRISEHIGRNLSTISKEDYIKRNLDRLTEKELQMRKPLLEDLEICYSDRLLLDVELLSIRINNLLEVKDVKDPIMIEFAKDFIFNSNNIEGSMIPSDEVRRIIETGDSKYENLNEVTEVYNSIQAMRYIRDDYIFNIPSIKRLYYILSKNLIMSNGESYPRGFKKVNNIVNNMETVAPDLVEPALQDLINEYKQKRRTEHPFKLAFDLHLRYEEIHPFLDGNGRTGRLIMNKVLMGQGYFPIIIYSKNKEAYSNSISKALSGRGIKNYYQFMLKQTEKTYRSYQTMIEEY